MEGVASLPSSSALQQAVTLKGEPARCATADNSTILIDAKFTNGEATSLRLWPPHSRLPGPHPHRPDARRPHHPRLSPPLSNVLSSRLAQTLLCAFP